jgi:hypothetical protein
MPSLRYFVLIPLLALCLCSCKQRDEHHHDQEKGVVDQVGDHVGNLFRDAKDRISDYAPNTGDVSAAAQKQFQDMMMLEYKVVEVDSSAPPQKLQEVLTALGQERWECFDIMERGSTYMIPGRRRPVSLLRYALRFLPFP